MRIRAPRGGVAWPRCGAGSRSAARSLAWAVAALTAAWLGVPTILGQALEETGLLRYGLSLTALSEVNPNDAVAATQTWVREVGRASGSWRDARATLFPDTPTMLQSLNNGRIDVVALSSPEYLAVESTLHADPFLVYEQSGEVEVEYVLLVRNTVRSMADLQNGRVAIIKTNTQRELADTWLDVELLEAGLPEKERAFSQLKIVRKRSQAVMALFFKQVDAAVEPRSAFETAVELNPQIGRELKVLARSPRLLPGLACIRRSVNREARQRYVEHATRLHQQPGFRQTFLVLRVTRLVAWNPHFLDTARTLTARYQALRRKAAAR